MKPSKYPGNTDTARELLSSYVWVRPIDSTFNWQIAFQVPEILENLLLLWFSP